MPGLVKRLRAGVLGFSRGVMPEPYRPVMIAGTNTDLRRGLMPVGTATPPQRGTFQLLQAYGTMPWLRKAAGLAAQGVGETRWRLLMASPKAAKKTRDLARSLRGPMGATQRAVMLNTPAAQDLIEIEDHPLLDLLRIGNDELAGNAVSKLTQVHFDLCGEYFSAIERNGAGLPVALWPIPPVWVMRTPVPSDPQFWVSYRAFTAEIPASEMLWQRDPDPIFPYGRGTGIGKTLGDELETDEYLAKFTKHFFYNFALPQALFYGPELAKENADKIEAAWQNKLGGYWNRFKTKFLKVSDPTKLGIHEFKQNLDGDPITTLRKFEGEMVRMLFNVPPELIGIIEKSSNRATAEAADFHFEKYAVLPRREARRDFYQQRLVPQFDDRLILDFEASLGEDKQHSLDVLKAAPWAAELDEVRRMLGLSELPDGRGQALMIPFNVTPTPVTTLPTAADELQPPGSQENAARPWERTL